MENIKVGSVDSSICIAKLKGCRTLKDFLLCAWTIQKNGNYVESRMIEEVMTAKKEELLEKEFEDKIPFVLKELMSTSTLLSKTPLETFEKIANKYTLKPFELRMMLAREKEIAKEMETENNIMLAQEKLKALLAGNESPLIEEMINKMKEEAGIPETFVRKRKRDSISSMVILDYVDTYLEKFIMPPTKIDILQAQNFKLAHAMFEIYLHFNCHGVTEFQKVSHCPPDFFDSSIHTLKREKDPLYMAHINSKKTHQEDLLRQKRSQEKERQKESVEYWKKRFSTSSIEEQQSFLSPKNKEAIIAFCELNNLEPSMTLFYLKNKKKNLPVLLAQNPAEKRQSIQEYQKELEEKIEEVASKMNDCLVVEKEKKNAAPLFNAYQYFLNNKESLDDLKSVAKELSKEDELRTINTYIQNHSQIFAGIKPQRMKAYLSNKHMSCGDQEVDFSKQDFDLAIQTIDERALPLTPIVLFGAINYQVTFRKLQESLFGVKKKTKK